MLTGAAIKSGCMLTHIQSCMEAMNQLQNKQDQLKDLEKELRQLDAIAKRYNTVKQQVNTHYCNHLKSELQRVSEYSHRPKTERPKSE